MLYALFLQDNVNNFIKYLLYLGQCDILHEAMLRVRLPSIPA